MKMANIVKLALAVAAFFVIVSINSSFLWERTASGARTSEYISPDFQSHAEQEKAIVSFIEELMQ